MSLIDTISKPRWQHSNPEVRKAAIDQLDDETILTDLVNSDPDAGIRSHALSRITSARQLDELIETLTPPLLQQARAQRLQQLLPDSSALPSINDDDLLVRIAGLSDDQDLIISSISRVQSSVTRMEVAIHHPVAKVRLCAAQGIEEIDQLQQLLRASKNKDKAVYRHCKDLVDQQHAAERAEAERQTQINELSQKATQLSSSVDSPDFKGRYQSLNQHWQELKSFANPQQHQEIQDALAICALRLENLQRALEANEEQQARIEEATQAFPALIAELEELDQAVSSTQETVDTKQINDQLDSIEHRWIAASRLAKATTEQEEECKNHLNQWRSIVFTTRSMMERKSALQRNLNAIGNADNSDFSALRKLQQQTEKLIAKLPWPDSHSAILPQAIKQLQANRDQLQEKLKALKTKEKQNLEHLQTAFEKLRAELETNHFKNADRECNRVKHILRQLNSEHQQQYQNELRPLLARLNEIHDWQGFAIEPKKIELCERMQSLADHSEAPDIQAGKIKALQKEWKKLGSISPHRDQELWKKFHRAADEAWKPCKQAFEQKDLLCQENFEQRMQLVAQLIDYERKMAWPDVENADSEGHTPDWKMVQKTLDTARDAFRNIRPVDRKGERKSQKKFRAVCDRIYSHIKAEYERNITLKKEFIDRAQALIELEDLKQAIDGAKRIQREWKEIGMTPVRVDRELWKSFRGACDAVFKRLNQQREQQTAAMGAQIKEAETLLKQARDLIDSDDKEQKLHLKKNLSELQTAFYRIELPRNVQQQMRKRFYDMEQESRRIVSEIRKQEEQASWQNLFRKMNACALKTSKEKKAVKQWEQEGELPKAIDATELEAFWQAGPGDTAEDVLRESCIAIEILCEIESPPEDKQARMNYQMKRLVEGIGSRLQIDKQQRLLQLISEFIALRPSAEWVERFCRDAEIGINQK